MIIRRSIVSHPASVPHVYLSPFFSPKSAKRRLAPRPQASAGRVGDVLRLPLAARASAGPGLRPRPLLGTCRKTRSLACPMCAPHLRPRRHRLEHSAWSPGRLPSWLGPPRRHAGETGGLNSETAPGPGAGSLRCRCHGHFLPRPLPGRRRPASPRVPTWSSRAHARVLVSSRGTRSYWTPSCPHFTPVTPLKALYSDTVMLVCYGGLRLQHTDRGAGDTARPVTHTQVPRLSSSLFRASAVLHLWDRPRRPLPPTALGQFAVEVEPPSPHPEPIPLASPGPHEGSCCVQTLSAFPWVSWG